MAPVTSLEHLSNPLVTSYQLQGLRDSDSDDSQSIRFAQCHLTQAAGILLRLPQEVIATAVILLQRYLVSSSPDTNGDSHSPRLLSAAALYFTAKISFTPLSPRSIINVYGYLTSASSPLWYFNPSRIPSKDPDPDPDPHAYFVSEGTYASERQRLFAAESTVLAGLGFDTQVALPHPLALTYLQTLSVPTPKLATRVLSHLNAALLSPQLLYLTHQPNALAVAAIYLAARELEVKLVEQNWWEVFDVDREDLGFLVLGLGSVGNYVESEKRRCDETGRGIPLG